MGFKVHLKEPVVRYNRQWEVRFVSSVGAGSNYEGSGNRTIASVFIHINDRSYQVLLRDELNFNSPSILSLLQLLLQCCGCDLEYVLSMVNL